VKFLSFVLYLLLGLFGGVILIIYGMKSPTAFYIAIWFLSLLSGLFVSLAAWPSMTKKSGVWKFFMYFIALAIMGTAGWILFGSHFLGMSSPKISNSSFVVTLMVVGPVYSWFGILLSNSFSQKETPKLIFVLLNSFGWIVWPLVVIIHEITMLFRKHNLWILAVTFFVSLICVFLIIHFVPINLFHFLFIDFNFFPSFQIIGIILTSVILFILLLVETSLFVSFGRKCYPSISRGRYFLTVFWPLYYSALFFILISFVLSSPLYINLQYQSIESIIDGVVIWGSGLGPLDITGFLSNILFSLIFLFGPHLFVVLLCGQSCPKCKAFLDTNCVGSETHPLRLFTKKVPVEITIGTSTTTTTEYEWNGYDSSTKREVGTPTTETTPITDVIMVDQQFIEEKHTVHWRCGQCGERFETSSTSTHRTND
jgi:hypothetical protein